MESCLIFLTNSDIVQYIFIALSASNEFTDIHLQQKKTQKNYVGFKKFSAISQ